MFSILLAIHPAEPTEDTKEKAAFRLMIEVLFKRTLTPTHHIPLLLQNALISFRDDKVYLLRFKLTPVATIFSLSLSLSQLSPSLNSLSLSPSLNSPSPLPYFSSLLLLSSSSNIIVSMLLAQSIDSHHVIMNLLYAVCWR